jgi:oligosaccharide repeat unit polymerase
VLILLYSILYKKWGISSYLIAVYLLTLIASLFITNIVDFYTESKEGSIVYVSALLLFFIPYLRSAPTINTTPNPHIIKKVSTYGKAVSWALIVLSVLILPAIIQSLQAGAANIRLGYYTYHGNFVINYSIKLIDIISPLSYTLMTLAFYMFAFVQGYDKEKTLFLIASLSAPYYGIMVGGRTQMIYWLLSLVFNYILFRRYLPKPSKNKLFKFLFIVVAFILVYIISVTVNRFSGSDWGTNDSLLVYMGQPYLNFCYFYENYNYLTDINLSRIFPLTDSLINGTFSLQDYRDDIFYGSGMNIGVFYTFLGDFLVDIGVKGIYIYAIIYLIVTISVLHKKLLDLSDLLLVGILFIIPLQGVFYYSFWKKQVTFCALLVFIFSRYIKRLKYD